MSNSSMIDRWNVIDGAKMAVGIQSVLSRTIKEKPKPYDFNESLDSGLAFLNEALSGGKIICGDTLSSQFTGTLSPLNWSTDVYTSSRKQKVDDDLYRNIVEILSSYKVVLEKIQTDRKEEINQKELKEALTFFDSLANILLNQADPTNKFYSHSIV